MTNINTTLGLSCNEY